MLVSDRVFRISHGLFVGLAYALLMVMGLMFFIHDILQDPFYGASAGLTVAYMGCAQVGLHLLSQEARVEKGRTCLKIATVLLVAAFGCFGVLVSRH